MKSLTLCIIGVLVTGFGASGCDDRPDIVNRLPDDATQPPGDEGPDDSSGDDTPGRPERPAHPESPDEPERPTRPGNAGGGQGEICPSKTAISAANHIVIQVSWPASLAIAPGQGEMHLWTKADLTFQGNDVAGKVRPCGSVIPALTKSSVVGGGQVQVEIPAAVWDAPSMPVFDVRGTNSGFAVGSTLAMEPVASPVGLTMNDPLHDPWPNQASQLDAVDHDGDGRPGIRGIPRTDAPFSAPPLDLGGVLDPNGARADEIDLATRTVLSLSATRDACVSATGTAQVTRVDSHVVGCHVRGGGACTRAQSDFIDAVQPRFTVGSATFEMIEVPAGATCADVRAALPVH